MGSLRALTKQAVRRYLSDEGGAATVEFVIIAPLFFAIVFSTFEAGWLMTKSMMLDRGLDMAVRDLRVDLINPATKQNIKKAICDYSKILDNCETQIVLEMVNINNINDYPATNAQCYDRVNTVEPVTGFVVGGRSTTMFIRACVVVDPIFPFLGLGLEMPKDPSGGIRMVSYSAFVNEPS
ncbi:MAG: TadE/TadG family type IV pilus assembly protein [Pseudomonadota bacterium]